MIELMYGQDCRESLKVIPSGSVHACITSPPYWGLRKYPSQEDPIWGGSPDCAHTWDAGQIQAHRGGRGQCPQTEVGHAGLLPQEVDTKVVSCSLCGAWRGQLGHEDSPDLFVSHLVEIFREVWRVLHPEGLLWVNLGDTYSAAGAGWDGKMGKWLEPSGTTREPRKPPQGFKPKDLIGIPWRVALALQADGWYLRSDIIWNKPNAMPRAVRDRVTNSHEYVFMLSKSYSYHFGEPALMEGSRHRRSVWSVNTQPYADAHFACYPEELLTPMVQASPSHWCPQCCRVSGEAGECCGKPLDVTTILDPFSGSGTTGVVANRYGRKYLGLDQSLEYKVLAERRLGRNKMPDVFLGS